MRVPVWRSRPPTSQGSSARGDIQALRAVAVALVVSAHVAGGPVGGFVGVDVFFVVSGFLITGLLLREHGRHGRISVADFYRRRARRIVPVAVLVLAVTVAATFALYNAARGQSVADDAGWALVFLANWHFAASGTDYFAAGGPLSPLQHYWSLSVEEQFYVVWPALLVLVLWSRRRSPAVARRRTLFSVVVLVCAASLAYSMWHSQADPTAAYFSTLDRAWELAAGGALALSAGSLSRLHPLVRTATAWVGWGAIAAAALLITESSSFPAPTGLLPVAGTLLVLAAGTGQPVRFVLPLVNPLTRYIGDVSYSLYLWHFPVAVLAVAYFPEYGGTYQITVAALTLGLAVISYHLVEDPVRHSTWLEPRRRKLLMGGPSRHSNRVANGWVAVGVGVAVLLSMLVLRPPAVSDSALLAPSGTAPTGTAGPDGTSDGALDYLQQRIEQSLALTDFPDLEPSVDALGLEAWYSQAKDYGCVTVVRDTAASCRYGEPSARRNLVVLGDSIAVALMPAVREGLGSRYRIQQLTMQECPPFDVVTNHFDGAAYPECSSFRRWSSDLVAEMQPDVVLVVFSYAYPAVAGALASGSTGTAAVDEIEEGVERLLTELTTTARHVVLLSPPPGAGNLQECVTRVGEPSDCTKDISPPWYDFTDMLRRAADATGGVYLDTRAWFCVDQYCPGFVGPTPTYADGGHPTHQYARELGPVLAEQLSLATR